MAQQEVTDVNAWVSEALASRTTYQEAREYIFERHPEARAWRDQYQSEVRGAGVIRSHGKLTETALQWLHLQNTLSGRMGGRHNAKNKNTPNGAEKKNGYSDRYRFVAERYRIAPRDDIAADLMGCTHQNMAMIRNRMIDDGWKAIKAEDLSWRFVPPPEKPKEITLTEAQLSEIVSNAVRAALKNGNGSK
jgi:hypothetical protein